MWLGKEIGCEGYMNLYIYKASCLPNLGSSFQSTGYVSFYLRNALAPVNVAHFGVS